jgi:hypothetical protein
MKEELRYYPPPEASVFLKEQGIKAGEQTLAKYRSIGGGPKFAYFGRYPRYREDWLLEFAQSRISRPVHSTSEPRATRKAVVLDPHDADAGAAAKPLTGAKKAPPPQPSKLKAAASRNRTRGVTPAARPRRVRLTDARGAGGILSPAE